MLAVAAEIIAYLIVAAAIGFSAAWFLRGAVTRGERAGTSRADIESALAEREQRIAELEQRLSSLTMSQSSSAAESKHAAATAPVTPATYEEIPRFLEQLGVGAARSMPHAPKTDALSGDLFEAEAPAVATLARDDLKRVRGIGRKFEHMLNELGVHSYRQIALWRDEDIEKYARLLHTFPDRVRRDDWMRSAREQHLVKYGERL